LKHFTIKMVEQEDDLQAKGKYAEITDYFTSVNRTVYCRVSNR